MASRKEQKEAARQRRLEAEREAAERARRQQRLRMTGGIVVAVVAVLAVVIAISSGGSSKANGLTKGAKEQSLVSQVSRLLDGIPQSGATLGKPSAPVTMTYYGDLECPVCRDFTVNGGFPQLVANEVRQGKVKVVYQAFETATPDPTVFRTQQVAALAAGKQNKFWNFVELFYHEQGAEGTSYVNESYLSTLASQSGVNVDSWQSARSDPSLATAVTSQVSSGTAQGVTGTPTLIFQGPHGKAQPQSAVPSYSELQQDIKQVA
jgi:protein-disulfide isomerase